MKLSLRRQLTLFGLRLLPDVPFRIQRIRSMAPGLIVRVISAFEPMSTIANLTTSPAPPLLLEFGHYSLPAIAGEKCLIIESAAASIIFNIRPTN